MIIVGIDWARCKHDIVIMHSQGQVLQRLQVNHDAQGMGQLAAAIAGHEPHPQNVRVAVEMHNGALLAWLLDQGYAVFGINPKSAQRARDRYRPAGGKDDASDAFILADMLRTDRGTLRSIRPHSDATVALRSLVELRADRVGERTACILRLRARLDEWCPDLSGLCGDLARIWQRRLLERFPLQDELHDAHGRTLTAFIAKHRLRDTTAQRIHATRQATPMPIPQARRHALRLDITQLLAQIEWLTQTIDELDQCVEEKLAEHPDAQLFASLPVKGTQTLATLIAGFGEDRQHAPSHRQIAAAWGVAPLTIQSGKYRNVKRRHAADQLLCQALLNFAFNTAFTPGCWAGDYYQQKRKQGTPHYTALRCLAQRWVKILHAMWKHQTPYDEQRHQQNLSKTQNRNAA